MGTFTDSGDVDKPATGAAAVDPEQEAPAAAPDDDTGVAETAELPDLTGQSLQAAQDAAQAAGFYVLTSSDATGAGRMQVLDRNWQVCSQIPAAGSLSTDTVVDFSTVKIEETCP